MGGDGDGVPALELHYFYMVDDALKSSLCMLPFFVCGYV